MKEATVAIEDQRFYEHRGIDYEGIGRAVFQDILSMGATQGGSTITQQFVKNALRAQRSRTVFEKLREAALAYQLERHWDKDKILTEYLNEIYFGEGAYGIEAAAKTYFGWNHPGCGEAGNRCASQLLPWEAAMLAGLISNPSGFDPKVAPEAATARRNLVLQNMADQGYIDPGGGRAVLTGAAARRHRRSRPRRRTRGLPTSPPGSASSWSTSTAPERRSAAGSTSSRPSTSRSRRRRSRSPTTAPPGSA